MTQKSQAERTPSKNALLRRIATPAFWDKYDLRRIQPMPAVATDANTKFNISAPLLSLDGVYQNHLKSKDTKPPVRFYKTTGAKLVHEERLTLDCPHGVVIRPGHAIEKHDGTLEAAHWSTVELIVDRAELDDSQQADRVRRSFSLLLMARPDLVVAQAIGLGKDDCTFFFAESGSGIVYTKVAYTDPEFIALLMAFLHRALIDYTDMLDRCTKRRYDDSSNSCRFDITFSQSPPVVYPDYRLRYSCSPFERRTHVFVNTSDTVKLVNGYPVRVIKDQWIRPHAKALEKDILSRVHGEGRVPAVTYSPYSSVSDLGPSRSRLRIVMDQCGSRFTGVSTIKQGLCLIYDLLEVTRFLYKARGVLHRDISVGNVMISSTHYEPKGDLEKAALSSLRFSANLLDRSVSQWKTELLLIDFGCGEIISDRKPNEPFEAVGTPIFMARVLEKGTVYGVGYGTFPTFPSAPPIYAELCPDRVAEFPEAPNVDYSDKQITKPPVIDQHLLFYDAESVLWLLIYWLFFVQPAESTERQTYHPLVWGRIDSDAEDRQMHLALLAHVYRCRGVHPAFSELHDLLADLSLQALYNPHVFDLPSDHAMKRPDYTHEAFQRHILAFIQTNNDAEFMNRPIRSWAPEDLPKSMDDAQKSVVPSKRAREEQEPEPALLDPKDGAEKDNLELPQPPPRKRSRLSAEPSR